MLVYVNSNKIVNTFEHQANLMGISYRFVKNFDKVDQDILWVNSVLLIKGMLSKIFSSFFIWYEAFYKKGTAI